MIIDCLSNVRTFLAHIKGFSTPIARRFSSQFAGSRSHTFGYLFHPMYLVLYSPFFSRSLLLTVVTQIRGHKAGSSPPSHYGSRLPFYREKSSVLSSLVDSRQIRLTHAIIYHNRLYTPPVAYLVSYIRKRLNSTPPRLFYRRSMGLSRVVHASQHAV